MAMFGSSANAAVTVTATPLPNPAVDAMLQAAMSRFAAVVRVDLSRLSTFTPAALTYVVGVRGVTALDMTECPQVADAHIAALAAPPPQQPEASTEPAAAAAAEENDGNDTAKAEGGDGAASAAAAQPPTSPNTNTLKQLILRGCTKINDGCLGEIAVGCPDLSTVVLDGTAITSAALELLGAGCSALRSVSLKSIKSVGDAGIVGLAKGCPQLKEVFLDNCGGAYGSIVTNASLDGLVAHCSQLQVLSLVGCANVTDAGVTAVLAACHALTDLDLTKCSAVTDVALMSLCLHLGATPSVAAGGAANDGAGTGADTVGAGAGAAGSSAGAGVDESAGADAVAAAADVDVAATDTATAQSDNGKEITATAAADAAAADAAAAADTITAAASAGPEQPPTAPYCPLLRTLKAEHSGVTVQGVAAVLIARPALTSVGGWGTVLLASQVASRLSFVGDPQEAALAVANGEMVNLAINLSNSSRLQTILTAQLVCGWATMIPPNVTTFDLRGNKYVTDDVLDALGTMLQDAGYCVKEVNLFGCRVTIDAVERLALRCPTITEIEGWGLVLSPVSIADRLQMEGQLLNLSDTFFLTAAIVEQCIIPESVVVITLAKNRFATNDAVAMLAKECPQLTVINLANCYQITSVACIALAASCPRLASVDLTSCPVTEDGIFALLRGCPDLEEVDSHFEVLLATNVEDHITGDEEENLDLRGVLIVEEIVAMCSIPDTVIAIDLSDNTLATTDGVIAELAMLVPGLEVLEVQGCQEVTDAGLLALAEYSLDLTVIDVTGCSGITFAGVAALAEACTELVEVVGCGMVLSDDMLEDLLPFDPTAIERFRENADLAAVVSGRREDDSGGSRGGDNGASDHGDTDSGDGGGGGSVRDSGSSDGGSSGAGSGAEVTAGASDAPSANDDASVDVGAGTVLRIASQDLHDASCAIIRADSSEDYDITGAGGAGGAGAGGESDDGGDSNGGNDAAGAPQAAADAGDADGSDNDSDADADSDDAEYQPPVVQLDLRKELWGKNIIITPVVLQRCEMLQGLTIGHLDLRGNDFVFDEVLDAFADQCHAVWVVDIEHCDTITEDGVDALATKCAGLRYVTGWGVPLNKETVQTCITTLEPNTAADASATEEAGAAATKLVLNLSEMIVTAGTVARLVGGPISTVTEVSVLTGLSSFAPAKSWDGAHDLVGAFVAACPKLRKLELAGSAGQDQAELEGLMPDGATLSFTGAAFTLAGF